MVIKLLLLVVHSELLIWV